MKGETELEFIQDVWNTGAVSPFDLRGNAILQFKAETKSEGVVALRWRHCGAVHQTTRYARALPDLTGVTVASERTASGTNWLDVINANGTLRFRMHPPPLDERYDHTISVIESVSPGWPASGIALGVRAAYCVKVGSLGFVGIFLEIDWNTGELKRWLGIPQWV